MHAYAGYAIGIRGGHILPESYGLCRSYFIYIFIGKKTNYAKLVTLAGRSTVQGRAGTVISVFRPVLH